MKALAIPENTEELVIIPSNEKGTGFLRNLYDERFLTGFITKEQFDKVIDECSKINARKYSEKRKADTEGTQKSMIMVISASYILTMAFFVTMFLALEKGDHLLSLISYIFLTVAFFLMTFVAITNYMSKKNVSNATYSEMVTKAIDKYFRQANLIYRKDNVEWAIVEGHFWIELRILDKIESARIKQEKEALELKV